MKSALIAAIVAAIVASGSAVAATKLIDGHSIRNHTIPATKLTNAAIASLRTAPTTFTLVRGPNVDVPPSNTDAGTSTALCPSGAGPVGGGFIVTNGYEANPVVVADAIDTTDGKTADGWDVAIGNSAEAGAIGTLTFHSWAVCANQTIKLPG